MIFDLTPRKNRKTGLDFEDYVAAAREIGCELSAIRAVDAVESAGSGFLPSGRPKILFEGHLFYKALKKYGLHTKIAGIFPEICYPRWTKKHYKGGEAEYGRLYKAIACCQNEQVPVSLALGAASWSRYQILGSNYKAAGFDFIENFVNAMFLDEDNALEAFVAYVKSNSLADELRRKDWAAFARAYNGPGYKRNQYDIKMANAERKFRKAIVPALANRNASKKQSIDEILPCPAESSSACPGTSLDDRYLSKSPSETSATNPNTDETDSNLPVNQNPSDQAEIEPSEANSASQPATDPATNKINESENASLEEAVDTKPSTVSSALDKLKDYKDRADNLGVDSVSAAKGALPFLKRLGLGLWRNMIYIVSLLVTVALENPFWTTVIVVVLVALVYFRKPLIDYVKRQSKHIAGRSESV